MTKCTSCYPGFCIIVSPTDSLRDPSASVICADPEQLLYASIFFNLCFACANEELGESYPDFLNLVPQGVRPKFGRHIDFLSLVMFSSVNLFCSLMAGVRHTLCAVYYMVVCCLPCLVMS